MGHLKKEPTKPEGPEGLGATVEMAEGCGKGKHWVKHKNWDKIQAGWVFGHFWGRICLPRGYFFFPAPTCPLAESANDNRLALPAPLPLPPPMLY